MTNRTVLLPVVLLLVAAPLAAAEAPPKPTRVSGIISHGAGRAPVEGAFVYAYKESTTHFFGPPDHLSLPSNAAGAYLMDLPPGEYHFFARKRQSGSYQGPLRKEDWFSSPSAGAVRVAAEPVTLHLAVQRLEGQQFYRPEKIGVTTATSIQGRILDAAGKPVFGAYAFAYRDRFDKANPPQYSSNGSDAQGNFVLYLDQGGSFVIGARVKAKEPPQTGELVGFHKDAQTPVVRVETGSALKGVDVTLLPFAGDPVVKPASTPAQRQ
jgi:hypothetical protein